MTLGEDLVGEDTPDAEAGLGPGAQLEHLIHELGRDPLFAMSLGSKELFHSNLLAWFTEHHPPVARALTGWDVPVTVHREKLHTDVLVTADNRPPFVIENKMFSLPERHQLDRIAEKFAGQQPELVLLSLSAPAWAADGPWSWLSYRELAERLRPAVDDVSAVDTYAGATFERWLSLIDRMIALNHLVASPSDEEPLLLPTEVRELLGSARLDAPVQKMRCQHVAARLGGSGITAEARLTNNLGLVEWFTEAADGLFWGWQLQGEQFRLALIVPEGHPGHGKSAAHKAARQAEARQHPELFGFDPIDGAGAVGPQRLEFGDYQPCFVYRYVHIPGITIRQAVELGVAYTDRISRLVSA